MHKGIYSELALQWQIQHPDYEDCYVDGYACGLIELDEQFNPFNLDSIEGQYWSEGWWNAFYEEKPLFHLNGVNIATAQPKPHESKLTDFILSFIELSGVLMVSSLLSYQLWELVA